MTRHGEAAEGWQGIQGQYLIPTSATGCRNATNGLVHLLPSFRDENHNPLLIGLSKGRPLWRSQQWNFLPFLINAFKMVGFPLRCCIEDGKKAWSSLGMWQQKGLSKLFLSILQMEIHAFHRDSCSHALPIQAGPTSNVACPPNLVEWVVPSPPCQM